MDWLVQNWQVVGMILVIIGVIYYINRKDDSPKPRPQKGYDIELGNAAERKKVKSALNFIKSRSLGAYNDVDKVTNYIRLNPGYNKNPLPDPNDDPAIAIASADIPSGRINLWMGMVNKRTTAQLVVTILHETVHLEGNPRHDKAFYNRLNQLKKQVGV